MTSVAADPHPGHQPSTERPILLTTKTSSISTLHSVRILFCMRPPSLNGCLCRIGPLQSVRLPKRQRPSPALSPALSERYAVRGVRSLETHQRFVRKLFKRL